MSDAPVNAKFCWRCGNRVKAEQDRCWYCNAVVNRTIRPPRNCPVCGEVVAQEARKCPHCHEWLDGVERAAPREAVAPQQITFIIDKAVIQGDKPIQLLGGRPVPESLARLLSRDTIKAIENARPELLDQQGVKALPMSAVPPPQETDYTEEAPARESEPSKTPALPAPSRKTGKSSGLIRSESAPPASLDQPAKHHPPAKLMGALEKAGDLIFGALEKSAVPEEKPKAAEAPTTPNTETRYGRCVSCGVEVLADDYFCHRCGTPLRHKPKAAHKKRRVDIGPPSLGLYLFSALVTAAMFLMALYGPDHLPDLGIEFPRLLTWTLGGVSFLLVLSGILRRRTLMNLVVGLVMLAIWAGITYLALSWS
jgi:hypothetical protein